MAAFFISCTPGSAAARFAYPTRWDRVGPDRNIVHRRVLNLIYFTRRGNRCQLLRTLRTISLGI